jgi:predicted amidohydrolase YtcJ
MSRDKLMSSSSLSIRTAVGAAVMAALLVACSKPQAESAGTTAAPPAAATGDASPELILTNGEFYTGSGWAQAVAIRKGVLVAVGDVATVDALKGAGTKVVDLKGAAVLPGLHDHHVHAIGSGESALRCSFPQGSNAQVIRDTLKACVAKKKPGEWISGGQWDAASLGDTPLDRAFLDEVSPDNPVALNDISMHAVWLNTAAVKLAKITKDSQPPPGGVIERRADGEPTGVLRESARALMGGLMPPPTVEQQAEGLKWSQNEMLKYGVTSFTDAGVGLAGLQVYALLADRGELKQRVRGCIAWRMAIGDRSADDVVAQRHLYARDRFKPDCIKMGLDGVPTEGHTAAMLEPYADAKGKDPALAKGILMVPTEELNRAVTNFDASGLTVKLHAAGDAAVRAGLDAIAAARKANGNTGLFHNVSHNSFISKPDLARAAGIQATFEMSPYIWYQNPIIPAIAQAIGPERMKRWTPVKEAIDSGALVVPGSDWAVVPSVNPWIAIETLVTRLPPGGKGEPLGEIEKITLEQAFQLFTVNGARQMGNADKTGAIARGLLADLVVVDRNPFKIPVTEIHNTKVLQTYINGEVVYEAPR